MIQTNDDLIKKLSLKGSELAELQKNNDIIVKKLTLKEN